MYIDANLRMSNAQAVTATAASTDYIDTLAAGECLSPGARWQVLITTAVAASGGASTTTFALQTATDTAFTVAVTLVASADTAKASLLAGTVVMDVQIPKGVLRYLRTYYTVSTNNWTAGNVTSMIVLDSDNTIDKTL